jgi:hypothetical protein
MSKKKTEVLEVSRGQPVLRLEITVDAQKREKIRESRLRWYGHVKRMEVKDQEQGVGVDQ